MVPPETAMVRGGDNRGADGVSSGGCRVLQGDGVAVRARQAGSGRASILVLAGVRHTQAH